MITTGVRGGRWRAEVTPWGGLQPWDAAPIDWYVAADDRWHRPSAEAAVRQRRISGTPVVETRLRIPGGDVVQRIISVADAGGLTLIEIHNETPLPIAVAFDSPAVVASRPPADVPIAGIDLPAHSRVFPVGHHARLTVAVAHNDAAALPAVLPSADAVVRGWLTACGRAGRFVVPDQRLAEAVVAARCEVLLAGPGDPLAAPASFLVAVGQMVRMGEPAAPWVPQVAAAVERVARDGAGPWEAEAALDAAGGVLVAAGETRAGRDLAALRDRRGDAALAAEPPEGILAVAWLEQTFADGRGRLLAGGWPAGWLGADVEAYGLPVGPATQLSYAVRWHGARPALLWETSGAAVTLTAPAVAPDWATAEPRGEVLWPAPAASPYGEHP